MKKKKNIVLKVITGLLLLIIIVVGGRIGLAYYQVSQDSPVLTSGAPFELGTTSSLTIQPLYEAAAAGDDLRAEHGVSYLITTDSGTVLLDLGNNEQGTTPTPLEENMQVLGVSLDTVDTLVVSHNHPDHVGGMKWWKNGTFSPGSDQVNLSQIPVILPVLMSYPGILPEIGDQPIKIAEGVATLGRQSFLQPSVFALWRPLEWEQSLVVNVEGKGLVVITGCGHPGVEKIVTRAESLFNLPVVGVVGGLHYMGMSDEKILPHLEFLAERDLQLVALSPHDSLPNAIDLFQKTFPDEYQYLKVGSEIHFPVNP